MDGAKNDRMVGFLTVFTILSHGVAATNICTGSVRETPAPHHDVITSPSYPDRYPRGAPCSLKLSFPHGFFIVLNVTDYRLTSKYLGLRKDKLLIKYGVYKTINPSAGTMSVLPSNEVTMKFIRNLGGHQSSRGFSLAYTAAPFHTACHATEELVRINRILFIASRNYPEHYDERMDCRVTVKAPPRHFLRIKSYDFKVERTPRCTFDFLKIKDPKTNITILNKTCGHTSFGVTAWSRIVTVYFRTDGSRNSKGFLLFLEAIPKPTFHTIPQMTMIGAQQTTRITVTNDVTTSQLNETSPTKDTGTARNLVLSATTPLTINQNPRDVLQHFENNVTLVPLTEPYRTTPNDGGGHVKNQGKASIADVMWICIGTGLGAIVLFIIFLVLLWRRRRRIQKSRENETMDSVSITYESMCSTKTTPRTYATVLNSIPTVAIEHTYADPWDSVADNHLNAMTQKASRGPSMGLTSYGANTDSLYSKPLEADHNYEYCETSLSVGSPEKETNDRTSNASGLSQSSSLRRSPKPAMGMRGYTSASIRRKKKPSTNSDGAAMVENEVYENFSGDDDDYIDVKDHRMKNQQYYEDVLQLGCANHSVDTKDD